MAEPVIHCPACGEAIALGVTLEMDRSGPQPVCLVSMDATAVQAHIRERHPEAYPSVSLGLSDGVQYEGDLRPA